MLFTSITFGLFFLALFILYWFIFYKDINIQNAFLLIASYIFYGWFDWYFLLLLFSVSLANYSIALLIQKSRHGLFRKVIYFSGLAINLGTLVIFKYFNFFIDNLNRIFSFIGFHHELYVENLLLPIGISFYIFLSLSYIIDVYHRRINAVNNVIEVLLAIAFFPIILAGPIHRPINLLPQIKHKRIFTAAHATDGLKQILWGVFMKVAVADNCALQTTGIFNNLPSYHGSTLLLGIFLFSIQIYADFAGYSNIAIGIGKLLGFNIMKNFSYPYFSRDIKTFWRSWNISLTGWFRDYIFLPIAYFISGKVKSERLFYIKTEYFVYIIGISITWVLTGLWHGANYTFIIWGLFQGLLLIIYQIFSKPRRKLLRNMQINSNNKILIIIETGFTFFLIMFSWILFRADNLSQALSYIYRICSDSLFSLPQLSGLTGILNTFFLISIFLFIEWTGKNQDYAIASLGCKWPKSIRWSMYYAIILMIFWFSGESYQFIYFQF